MRGSMRRWLLRAHIPLSIRSSSLPPWCRKIRRRSRIIRHPHPTSMVALLNFQTVRYFASRRFGMPFLIWRYRHPSYYLKNRVQPRQGGKNSWKPYDMVQYAHQPKKGACLLLCWKGIWESYFDRFYDPKSQYSQLVGVIFEKLTRWNWAFFCFIEEIHWKKVRMIKAIKNAEMYLIFRANRR